MDHSRFRIYFPSYSDKEGLKLEYYLNVWMLQVRYKDAAMFLRTLAEVKTLARLNHVNIVHYKAAWLEASPVPAEPVIVDADSGDASDGVVFQHSREEESESSSGEDNQLALCRLQPPPGSAAQVSYRYKHEISWGYFFI